MTTSTVRTLGLALAAIVSLGVWRSAEAGVIRTPYEGKSYFVGFGNPGKQWVAGGILHIRDAQQFFYDEASDSRISGAVTLTFGADFHFVQDPPLFPGYGPNRGTVLIENERGSWEGSWTATRTREGFTFVHIVMKGEGAYDGLYARADYVRMSADSTDPFDFAGTITELPAH